MRVEDRLSDPADVVYANSAFALHAVYVVQNVPRRLLDGLLDENFPRPVRPTQDRGSTGILKLLGHGPRIVGEAPGRPGQAPAVG